MKSKESNVLRDSVVILSVGLLIGWIAHSWLTRPQEPLQQSPDIQPTTFADSGYTTTQPISFERKCPCSIEWSSCRKCAYVKNENPNELGDVICLDEGSNLKTKSILA